MKTSTFKFLTILIFSLFLRINAQSPNLINYQAIVRSTGNTLAMNKAVGVKVSILQNTATGTVVYQELFAPNPTTNANGLLTLQIGSGTPQTGTFAGINWNAGPYFVKTEIDPNGGTTYSLVSTSQLLSVPYAMYSKTSASLSLPYSATVNNATSLLQITNSGDGTAIDGTSNSTVSSSTAVIGTISSTSPGGFSSGVRGVNNGTGGLGIGVWGSQNGSGWGVYGATPNGLGVYGNSSASGIGVYANSNSGTGLVATSTTGPAAKISIDNNANSNNVIEASSLGSGTVINITAATGRGIVANAASATTIEGITGSISAAGVIGRNATGEAIVGFSSGVNGVGAVVGRSDGAGYGVRGFNTKNGIGVFGQAGVGLGTGNAGVFENVNASNTSDVLVVSSNSAANLAVFKTTGNVARINSAGKGFFNGGTQVGGADIAEFFSVEGYRGNYEAGDVLVISSASDRTVEKSSKPYSALVSGVYATKPGVVLTEEDAVVDQLHDLVPMGVVGVIPTKVCLEGGEIKRGDLLVTSSISGVAMKADPNLVRVGQVLGKALQDFSSNSIGKIKVLVNTK